MKSSLKVSTSECASQTNLTNFVFISSSYCKVLKVFLQQLSKAFKGQGMNQSKIQQFIKAGNFLILILKFSPTGEVQNIICKLDFVFSTNKS